MAYSDNETQPAPTPTAWHEHRPILYLPDGRVLVRQAGFRALEPVPEKPSAKVGK